MLGTTFGGNHLACAAVKSVLKVIKKEKLMANAKTIEAYFKEKAKTIPAIQQVKGRGLMLGIQLEEEVSPLRKRLIYDHHIFTGGAKDKKVLRILPPLTIQEKHIDQLFEALSIEL